MSEIIFITVLAISFLITPLIFKQWWLLLVFTAFFTCFGLIEWISTIKTGKTVSQHFWALDKVNPTAGWIIVITMAIGWAALLIHFKWK